MSALLDKLRESQKQAQAAAARAYHKVVRALAADDDKGLELADLTEVLEAADVSTEELARDVSRRKQYDRLQAELKICQDGFAERPGLEAKIAAAAAELQSAEQRYRDAVHPWEVRLQEIRFSAATAADIERRLRELNFHPHDE